MFEVEDSLHSVMLTQETQNIENKNVHRNVITLRYANAVHQRFVRTLWQRFTNKASRSVGQIALFPHNPLPRGEALRAFEWGRRIWVYQETFPPNADFQYLIFDYADPAHRAVAKLLSRRFSGERPTCFTGQTFGSSPTPY